MGRLTESAQRRLDAAMLESLSGTFRILNDGGPFVCSFNYDDVSVLLKRAAELIKPRPFEVAMTSDRTELDRPGEGE